MSGKLSAIVACNCQHFERLLLSDMLPLGIYNRNLADRQLRPIRRLYIGTKTGAAST
jgi:hypothetical protein